MWERDLGVALLAEQWRRASGGVHTASVCARHGLIPFRVLHRLHYSKVKLSKMFPDIDSTCDRCKLSPASFAHSFWLCPNLPTYWSSIFQTLPDIFKMTIRPDPLIAIFGVAGEENKNLSGTKLRIIEVVTLLARRLILLHWKNPHPPSRTQWLREVMQHLKLEKLRYTLNGSSDKFVRICSPFMAYILAKL